MPSYHQSRHRFDQSAKVDHVSNNMIESFNNQFDLYKSKPIMTLLGGEKKRL